MNTHILSQQQVSELIGEAFLSQKRAYAPYSHFQVGAALLCADGSIYGGCNIENASYGACNCAERTALFRAVYDGKKEFCAIAIVGKLQEKEGFDFCAPCGICRQVMAEFCDPDAFQVIVAKSTEDYRIYLLKELLPLSFTGSSLSR